MKINDRMKMCRKSWGFTQTQIAEYLEVQQGQVAKLENGTRTLRKDAIKKLIPLFGVNEDWFVDGVGESGLEPLKNSKNFDPKTIIQINKLTSNIKFLSEITEGIE